MPRGLWTLASSEPPTFAFQPPTSKLVETPGCVACVFNKKVTFESEAEASIVLSLFLIFGQI